MKIKSKAKERKRLVYALEEATGCKSKYLFSPSFAYEVGPYTVERSGDVTVDDADVKEEDLEALIARDLIEDPREEAEGEPATIISLPLEGHDGRSLKNLVYLLHAKGALLGKAVGQPRYYRVDKNLIDALGDLTPETTEDFMEILSEAGKGAIHGLWVGDKQIDFYFPCTEEPERIHTYMQLSELISKTAKAQKHVRPDKSKETNEKYTFRVWLLRLGMKGEKYRDARRILLKNLKGNSAFRTKDQEEAAKKKLKVQRAKEKETANEMAFEEL